MKKLLAICLLLTTTFTARAQKLSFEETVKYINDKIICCTSFNTKAIEATKNGDVTMFYSDKRILLKFNFFDIENDKSDNSWYYRNILQEEYGIACIKYNESSEISIKIISKSSAFIPDIDSEATATKIMKALMHLRSLCTKTKDPFEN